GHRAVPALSREGDPGSGRGRGGGGPLPRLSGPRAGARRSVLHWGCPSPARGLRPVTRRRRRGTVPLRGEPADPTGGTLLALAEPGVRRAARRRPARRRDPRPREPGVVSRGRRHARPDAVPGRAGG